MAITKPAKLGIALLSTGSIGGATAYGIYEFNRETIKDKLKGTLLTKEEADKPKWRERATALKTDDTVSESLKKIKNGNADGTDIQNWCNTNLKNKFSSEKDKLFQEIQKYCVYNIKEKVGQVIEITSWNSDSNNKLKNNVGNKKLSDAMTKVKEDLTKQQQSNENALKEWCGAAYKKPYKGEKNQDYLDTKEYCTA